MLDKDLAKAVSKLVEDCSAINPAIHIDRLKAIFEIWLEKLQRQNATVAEVRAIGILLTDMRSFPLPADVMDALASVRACQERQLRTYWLDGQLTAMDPADADSMGLTEGSTMFELDESGRDGIELLGKLRGDPADE